MKQLTPEVKHSILTHYTSPLNRDALPTILSLHDVSATRQSVEYWRKQWNGTIDSLRHKEGAGRPRVLSEAQVRRHIAAPIRNSNRTGRPIHYTQLLPSVQAATHTNVSLQTIQRYGKQDCNAKNIRGRKRTVDESKYIHTSKMC
jgi:hypothetical protein